MTRRLADVIARGAVALGVSCAVAAAVTGCNPILSKREVVVHFTLTATPEQHRAAQAACTGVAPHTHPEPIVHDKYASSRVADVRFRVDKANDHDLAQLYNCLGRQPGVLGVSDPQDMTR
jgi:hypothetical protein